MPNGPVPAAAPGLPSSRRGFLRGLTTLPLICGGVTLIGQPSAVAEPVTVDLLKHYLGFVVREHRDLLVEIDRREIEACVLASVQEGFQTRPDHVAECVARKRKNVSWIVPDYLSGFGVMPTSAGPEARAALVLSAVGFDWKGVAA